MFPLLVIGALVNGLIQAAVQHNNPQYDRNAYANKLHHAWQSLPRIPDTSQNCIAWNDERQFSLVACDKDHPTRLRNYIPPLEDEVSMEGWTRYWLNFIKVHDRLWYDGKMAGLSDSEARAYASRYREACETIIREGGKYTNFTVQAIKAISNNLASFACAPADLVCHMKMENVENGDEIVIPIVARKLPLHIDYIKKFQDIPPKKYQ